jgi:hypothetical protein
MLVAKSTTARVVKLALLMMAATTTIAAEPVYATADGVAHAFVSARVAAASCL